MSDPTPKASADEVREALAAATPGPWWMEKGAGACVYAHVPGGRPNGEGLLEVSYYGRERPNAEANAHLIANAPTWLAQLLAALEASERENERLREALAEAVKWLLGGGSQRACDLLVAALAPSTPPDLREDA